MNAIKSLSKGALFAVGGLFGFIFAIGLLVAIKSDSGGSDSADSNTNSEGTKSASVDGSQESQGTDSTQKRQDEVQKATPVEPPVTKDNFQVNISRTQRVERIGPGKIGDDSGADSSYYLVFAQFSNKGKEARSPPGDFELVDGQNRIYSGTGGGAMYSHFYDAESAISQIQPGTSKLVMLAFEIPDNANKLTLHWYSSLWEDNEEVAIKL